MHERTKQNAGVIACVCVHKSSLCYTPYKAGVLYTLVI